jgi:hypothetical protein
MVFIHHHHLFIVVKTLRHEHWYRSDFYVLYRRTMPTLILLVQNRVHSKLFLSIISLESTAFKFYFLSCLLIATYFCTYSIFLADTTSKRATISVAFILFGSASIDLIPISTLEFQKIDLIEVGTNKKQFFVCHHFSFLSRRETETATATSTR